MRANEKIHLFLLDLRVFITALQRLTAYLRKLKLIQKMMAANGTNNFEHRHCQMANYDARIFCNIINHSLI
jgi:hypothetical protein